MCAYQQLRKYFKAGHYAQGPQWKGWCNLKEEKLDFEALSDCFEGEEQSEELAQSYLAATIYFQPLMDKWRRKLKLGLKHDPLGIYPIKPQRKCIVYYT